jgi:E3 ubiquitin-protein ligase DOA10
MMQYFERVNGESAKNGGGLKNKINLEDLEGVCRICLGEEEDALNDPLFSPCKCAGSMGLIHLQCLKEWLKNKKIQRIGEVVSTYFWKNLECELCK